MDADNKLYDLLNVARDASDTEIKKVSSTFMLNKEKACGDDEKMSNILTASSKK
jgi:hypothetical protein